ncbi:MAG: hypothetical protein J0L75_10115 [Spirochaetes bacterium]|nr:hypothetical protein [Spirochaetota bacterium]
MSPEQGKVLDRLTQHLASKVASEDQLLVFLQKSGFPPELCGPALAELKVQFPARIVSGAAKPTKAESDADPGELVKKYFAALYQRFLSDPLFLFELEAISRNKDNPEFRLGIFLDYLPFFLPLDQPNHAALLLNPKIRALYAQQLTKLFVEPMQRVLLTPGILSLKKFIMLTGLKGQPFLEATAQMEKDSWADIDMKRDEIRFQVKKINQGRAQFRAYLELLKGQFPEGEATVDKILVAFDSTISVPDNQPASKPFQRIVTKTIPFNHLDLKAADSLRPETLHGVLYEALLLLNFFRRTDTAKSAQSMDLYVQYADKLTLGLRTLAEKTPLGPFPSKQLTRIFACLSMMQGKSLMIINEFYRSRNALEYDGIVALLKKAY